MQKIPRKIMLTLYAELVSQIGNTEFKNTKVDVSLQLTQGTKFEVTIFDEGYTNTTFFFYDTREITELRQQIKTLVTIIHYDNLTSALRYKKQKEAQEISA